MSNLAEIYKFPEKQGAISEKERRKLMSEKGGFANTYRSIDQQPWSSDGVCMLIAQYLIRSVAFKALSIEYRGNRLKLSAGQFVTTVRELAAKAAINSLYKTENSAATATNRALVKLENDGFLTRKSIGKTVTQCTVISLPNYSKFNQKSETRSETCSEPRIESRESLGTKGVAASCETRSESQNETRSESLNKNDINNKDLITPLTPQGVTALFDVFWKAYPNKKSKPTGRKAFEKIAAKFKKNPDELDQLVKRINDHVEKRKTNDPQWSKDSGQFIPMPATFLNQERWNDEYTTGASHESSQHNFTNQSHRQQRSNPNTRYSDAQAYLESRGLAGPRESAGSSMDETGSNVYGPMESGTWGPGQ
ncbi:hypothetical protein EI165_00145 [Pseudoalteromonas nigrifaciens]|uniref:hypothetical protein n=1 Tax=Pseudoalteromonas nigrifaciens TaxID=28109 RepID=UPI0017881CF6|nr:hypothetical protein [Pseudoalteromonas nigrifaciens]MBE0418529.1 hypothetical protein [Pseudoalteromonas nigrifaciens]